MWQHIAFLVFTNTSCNSITFEAEIFTMQTVFNYGVDHLTVNTAIAIATGKIKALLNGSAIAAVNSSQQYVQQIVDHDTTVYGINTGFGILSNTKISAADTTTLQHKILQSHSVGVGDPIPVECAKADADYQGTCTGTGIQRHTTGNPATYFMAY